jgi:type IV pilus assembly protein PilV
MTNIIPNGTRRRHNGGTSMIEVLVAIIILVFGVLGVAAMQATALRNSQSAMDNSQAVVQIYTILDRMRANVPQARIGLYNLGNFGSDLSGTATGTTVWTCGIPSAGGLPENERRAWMQALKTNLGDNAGTCGIIDCSDQQCDIAVKWNDERGSGGSTAQIVTTRSRL